MASLLKNLLGNGSNERELTEEMRELLRQMRQERDRFAALVEGAAPASARLEELSEPIAKAANDVDGVTIRLRDMEQRLEAVGTLAQLYQELEDRAAELERGRRQAEEQISGVAENSQQIRSIMEELAQKAELAESLKEQLSSFMQVEQPFQVMRGEADAIRTQVEAAGDTMSRLREQNDRLIDSHKTAMQKMEALDRRRDELGRDMTDKERRVAGVEQAVRGIDGVQHTVNEVRREMGTLKAMADLVAQKTAALEAQREAVERALAQAENLDRAMKQIDGGVQQQHANEKSLNALNDQVASLRSLHESVLERSGEISQLQRQIDEQIQSSRHDLASVTDETKRTIERFDFERRGLESVTQRVADLRSSLSDCENRFSPLSDASRTMAELVSRTETLGGQLQGLEVQAVTVDREMSKLQAMRRELDDTHRIARELGTQVAQVVESRPALDAGLRDLAQLASAHAAAKDALEHAQLSQAELVRMRENQSQTKAWLATVEQSVTGLREQTASLQSLAPTIEFVHKQTERIAAAMAEIEQRREYVENLSVRMSGLEQLNARLDERARSLDARMQAAEQRFAALSEHAEEAERMTMTVAAVSSSLSAAGRDAGEVRKTVEEISARAKSVEAVAEQTETLRKEIEQRQRALAETAKELKRISALRQESAAESQQLDEMTKQLAAALATAEERVELVGELSGQLEDRASGLRTVEKRLNQFEERLNRWNLADQNVSKSLEDIAARQNTVGALQADLDRMFAMAENTATHVREIAAAHREIEDSRDLLQEVRTQLEEVRGTATKLDERKRQLAKAEERLARADGLLVDVRSSLEALQGQKALVDQAVEKAGSLQFLLRQAEAVIDGLREERKTSARVRSAVALVGHNDEGEDDDVAKAA